MTTIQPLPLKDMREFTQGINRPLTGISETKLNQIQNGRQKPVFNTIRKLADALGVEPGDIEC